MKLLNMVLIAMLVFGAGVMLPGCASKSEPTVEGQVVTVWRGNLSTDITGVGNLALSTTVDLAFEMPGYVEEVLAGEGDSVEEGQLLAKLDTSAWDDNIAILQDAVTKAERALTSAQRQVTSKKRDLLQAQINLNNAELSLENTEETSTDPLEIEIKELGVELAEGKLEDAQIAIEDAQTAVDDAEKTLEDAQQNLADAMDDSPEIKAPFTGFITKVNVSGGDEVKKGTVAMTIADPNKFEANILVNETDMAQVNLGGDATVQVDSIPGLVLPAKLTHISPTATIQSNVVNYQVKVEIQSLQPLIALSQLASGNSSSANISSSQFAPRSKPGGSSGNLTQEQIQAMIDQRQQLSGGQLRGLQSQTSTTEPVNYQLREGLTVTVSITVQERNNVLLIPNQSITLQQRQAYVQVQIADGTTEHRAIETGINNSLYTEVTSGLSESEKVIMPQGTTTSSTTQQQQRQGGSMYIPGVGRVR
ncbi:efflux RND transporter periplasmic adaptor subunit [Chloroflexota bacterium]